MGKWKCIGFDSRYSHFHFKPTHFATATHSLDCLTLLNGLIRMINFEAIGLPNLDTELKGDCYLWIMM